VRARLLSIAVMLGAAATGLSWLSLQPAVRTLVEVARVDPVRGEAVLRVTRAMPVILTVDVLGATALVFLVLFFTVGRPLAALDELIGQLARPQLGFGDAPSGPLVSRISRTLKDATTALAAERAQREAQLTELRSANAQLLRAQTELVSSDRLASVGKLAAGVAHEVGNPLAGLLGYLSILKGKVNPEAKELVDLSVVQVERIDGIVRSLLELGRPSRGKPAPVELARVVDDVLRLLGASPELRGVERTVEVPAGLVVLAEVGPLSQVLINLVRNAAQAMNGSGRLWLRAEVRDGKAALELRDSGPGVPADVLPKLFEPFFTTKPAGQGTGLGLAVSRHLLTAMGGGLEVRNHPEGGACFTITLATV